jgi:hypothetical protein
MLASLRTSVDILIAPSRAFGAIAAGAATTIPLLAIFALNVASAALIAPAAAHVATLEAHGDASALPPQATIVWELFWAQTSLQVIWWPIMTGVLVTVGMRGARERGAPGPLVQFMRIFTLNVYTTIPLAIGAAVSGLSVAVHPASSFHTAAQLTLAFPLSLAHAIPGGNDRQREFLGDVDVFLLWSAFLTAYGYIAIAKTRVITAFAAVFGVTTLELLLLAIPAN